MDNDIDDNIIQAYPECFIPLVREGVLMDTRMKTKTPRLSFLKTATALGSFALGVAIPLQSAIALDDNILPSGGNVVGGSADLHYNGANRLDIHQTTNRVVIDWNKFDIGKNATTQFHQPNSGSLAVNRVVGPGQDPTKILGTLKANGTVMVLDRNGVIFGADSRVDVGGIIASTGQVDTAAIMGGNGPIEIMNATQGAIVQAGMMTIGEAGLAAFVAPTITNSGLIEAKLGRVVLASGEKATVDLYGDGLVELATDKPLQHAAISNSGTIHAEGGTVLMTASAAKDIVGDVINISGVVNASSATVKGGKIILEGANTKVSGTLDASGKKGGGEILIGGDYQGGGGTRTATNTTITSDAVIKASTTGTDGDGGKVIVWADNNTSFEGSIEARGGSSSGNGGLVETSGKKNLRVTGSVDASANNATGKNGEWLLDPQNVRITNSAGASVPVGGGDYNPTGTDNPFVVLDSSISAALSAGNNVTITTYNPGQSQAGNIDIDNATILKDNGGDATLTFKADNRIYTTGTNSITSTSGRLHTIFWMDADNNGLVSTGSGINIMNTAITTNGGDFFAGGGADNGGVLNDALGNVLYTGIAGDGRPDSFAYSNNGHGFDAESFTLDTGDGDITIFGKAGSDTGWTIGVRLYDDITFNTHNGNVLIIGEGGTTPDQTADGIEAYADITSTGSGSITLSGKGGSSATNGSTGVYSGNTISARDGAITFIGRGGGVNGIGVEIYGDVISDGDSTITFMGQGTDANAYAIDMGTNQTFGGAQATGDQVWIGDKVWLDSSADIRTSGSITLKPLTNSLNINIGRTGVGLNLTDVMLNSLFAGTLIIGDKDNGTGDIIIDSWNLSSKTHHVEVYGNDITVQDTDGTATPGIQLGTGNLLMHAKDGADLGSITLNAAINKALAGHSKIDLRADENIVLSAANMIASSGGSFDIILNADRDADQNGAVSMTNSTITTNGGYFVAGGGSGTVDSNGDNILGNGGTGADMVAAHGNATYTDGITISGGQINTGVGALALNGTGYAAADTGHDGISLLSGARLQSTSGNMRLIGRGGEGGTDFTRGILMAGASIIETQNGVLTLEGYGGQNTSGGDSIGVSMLGSADILVTDAGHIDITAVGGGGSFGAVGFKMETAGTSLVNTNGNIVVNATGGTPGDPWAYSDYGIYLSGVLVENTHGNITMTGTGTGSTLGFDNYGIFMDGSAVVQMLDDGDITMTGHGGQGNNADGFRMQNTDTAITNQNGAITLTGNNLYGNALGSEDGLILYIDARVEARGAGNLTLNGTTGLNDADSYGVRAMINGAISHTGIGDVIINAASNGGKDFVLNSSQLNANGNITLNTDAISIENGAAMATAQTLTITPRTATTTIGLGGGAGTLNLDDAELASISMNKFIIGDAVNGMGDVTIDSWDLSGTSYDTEIYGGKIIVGGAPYGLQNDSNNSLLLDASDSIDINSAINLDGALTLNAANSITVADADLTANGITADRSLTYDGTTGTTRILDAGSGILTLAGATAGNRNLTLIGDSMTLAGALTTGTGYNLNILPNTDGRDIMLGGGAGGLNLDDAELSYLQAGGLLTIGKQSTGTGNLTVNSAAFTSDVALYGGSTILNGLSSTGEILVASQGAGNDITLTHDVVSSAAGDAIILASADDFFNNAASAGNALRATNVNGRWLVYSERMDQNTRNGLMPHASEFGVSYPAVAAGAGNRFLYTSTVRPELTLTVNDDTVISGHAYNPAHAGYTITGGFLSGDTRNNIGLTGNLDYATSYVPGVTPASGSPHAGMITATGIGTLSSALGYSFNPVIGTGDLLVQGAPVSPPKPPVEINLPPLINYYANLNAITAHYPTSINIIRQPASYVDASGNLLDGNIEGLINIEGYVNNLEPASGNYINVDADVSRSRIMADNASCLVTNGFNGGCFIF